MKNQEKPNSERQWGVKMRHSPYWSILRLIQGRFIGDSAADGTPLQAIDKILENCLILSQQKADACRFETAGERYHRLLQVNIA